MTSLDLKGGSSTRLEVQKITKRFGPSIVNNEISLTFEKATIYGIIGENGAGKSTFVNILFGMIQPDSGTIKLDGIERHWRDPSDAAKAGIAMVHQHFMLAESEKALDHLLLTQAKWFGSKMIWPLNRKQSLQHFNRLAHSLGLELDLTKKISDLEMGDRQRLEILKALALEPSLLILDEPTAVLTPQESEKLFVAVKKLRDQGKTIVIISHKLKEIMAHTDHVSVIRKGVIALNEKTKNVTEKNLATAMIGSELSAWNNQRVDQNVQKLNSKQTKPLLEIKNPPPPLKDILLKVDRYEIVGVAGIEGNGQVELFDWLMSTLRKEKNRSVGIIPPDRIRDGLLPSLPIECTFVLGQEQEPPFASQYLGMHWIHWVKTREVLSKAIQEYSIAMSQADVKQVRAKDLSGGNQQKLLMARALFRDPELLLVAHPTRGVDIGAARMIHEMLLQKRNEGKGILLFSSDLDELFQLSDRLVVMFDGKIVSHYERPPFDEMKVGSAMGGIP